MPLIAAVPFRSLLGSERCILASAGGLSAGDPPSLGGDAAGATLSVNALVDMLAQHTLHPRRRVQMAQNCRHAPEHEHRSDTTRSYGCASSPSLAKARNHIATADTIEGGQPPPSFWKSHAYGQVEYCKRP